MYIILATFFPTLWEKLAAVHDEIIILKPIFDEIDQIPSNDSKLPKEEKRKRYPIKMWLNDNQFREIKVGDDIQSISLGLEEHYKITEKSKGAGKNDIILIAYAQKMKKTIVILKCF